MNRNLLFSAASAVVVLACSIEGAHAQVNTKYGASALPNNTSGTYNSAFGNSALYYNATGYDLVGTGYQALYFSTSSKHNTAIGSQALRGNSALTGTANTAFGAQALAALTRGNNNTATGYRALYANTGGMSNTAQGYLALGASTLGNENTAMGSGALRANLTGNMNIAFGKDALKSNTTGSFNTVIGTSAQQAGAPGSSNTAHGFLCLQTVTGDQNTGFGRQVMSGGRAGVNNTAIGIQALWSCSGRENIAVGELAGYNLSTESYNIDIGNYGRPGDTGVIRIGEPTLNNGGTFMAGVHGATVPSGVRVLVNADGRLGTLTSSRKFKQDIADMDSASEVIRRLRPVTFKYKPELDKEGIPQFGLIAEEVAGVAPDLVARDAQGEVYTVRYEMVNAMLLNEFQKQHRQVEAHVAKRGAQSRRLAIQEQTLDAQKEELGILALRMAELKKALERQAATKVD